MKRQILFRGKRTDNGEWVEGFLVISHAAFNPNQHCIIEGKNHFQLDSTSSGSLCFSESNTRVHEVHPESVGQFTGLTDRNGRKIFEDMNIVDCITKQRYQVKIGPCKRYGFSGVYGETDDGIQIPINGDYGGTKNSEIEIITDNPELLNTKP